ncbi:hypothetical protein V8E55_010321 [Tylopilus felleus]
MSGCNTWVDNLVSLGESLSLPTTSCIPPQPADSHWETENQMDIDVKESSDYFPGAARPVYPGPTFMDMFDNDKYSRFRSTNIYYPFKSCEEWDLALWLLRSGLSIRVIDSFLALSKVSKVLRQRAELLPGGPHWRVMEMKPSHPTRQHIYLYWRDPLECAAWLLNHLLFWDRLDWVPQCTYTTPEKKFSQLPIGVTVLGVILSSNKTNIMTLCGGRVAHPLLISLANIKMLTRLKLSSNSFMLTALLPVPKFLHKNKRMHGVLEDRLIHECLDIVLQPLKKAAQYSIMLPDPDGKMQYCFTPIASYIADTPKASMVACVRGKTSPITMAMYKQFGDPFPFFREAQQFHLNGVSDPFFRNFPLSCPSSFITPEMLHQLHKECWDQPTAGYRHFKTGISKLKQVTGRAHQDVQRYLISIRSLMDFRYRIQAYRIDSNDLHLISTALDMFHENKQSILNCGARQHAHITAIKIPAGANNNNNYDPQICRFLDRAEKCQTFEFATSIHQHELSNIPRDPDDGGESDDENDTNHDGDETDDPDTSWALRVPQLTVSTHLRAKEPGTVPVPLPTFCVGTTAIHLSYNPSIWHITAICDYLTREKAQCGPFIHPVGGPHRASLTSVLPFNDLQVWFKVQVQNMPLHGEISSVQMLFVSPPQKEWTLGRYDAAVINIEAGRDWPLSGLQDKILVFMQHFDICGEHGMSELQILKRATRTNGHHKGDVIPLAQIRAFAHLIPRFGASTDPCLTTFNSFEHSTEFYLNKYFSKDTSLSVCSG